MEMEKIFANYKSDQRLLSTTYTKLLQVNNKKTNDLIKRWPKDLNRHVSKKDIQTANTHMKICSTSLAIREMEIKAIMKYHFASIKMTKIKKIKTITSVSKDVEKF